MFDEVLTEREEKNSVAIASDEFFGKAHMFRRTCARRRRSGAGSCSREARVIRRAAVGHRP
ncbi:hypothetical protein [Streptomyces sp. NPDC048636]|uniref:hypothetical protein n=1 Tax=Streptomyces sp. NPDC048636 TaxID=3155762 RepID=UPI00343F8A51